MGKRRKSRRLQKKRKTARRARRASRASLAVVWGGERVAYPGVETCLYLIPPIRPPAINLSLKCQHVKFLSRMSA